MAWEGIYAAYMTASEGQGFSMFVFMGGRIVGADPFGVVYDGSYQTQKDGNLVGQVTVTVPPGVLVIQGATPGPDGMTYQVPLNFETDALGLDYITLETPLGPVNLRMTKIRELEREA
ncbi:hypothetical protein [Parasphingopyxis marina]|uniref:Uncharacterized protein n=1 Tax=Parasphingopyxis marina TaxID=2761622 RepID=A0A842HW10_9SPHN|nr:hypothetical protein [Parasphingopyxis marina]MBC2777296.1 hypothetical protein [Parasphingopyxis marina]